MTPASPLPPISSSSPAPVLPPVSTLLKSPKSTSAYWLGRFLIWQASRLKAKAKFDLAKASLSGVKANK